uniref:Kinesin-like protein n=1 Tax=Haptolina brevifila TaxID=156173 RepID=A0A7S2JBK5_9EUKA
MAAAEQHMAVLEAEKVAAEEKRTVAEHRAAAAEEDKAAAEADKAAAESRANGLEEQVANGQLAQVVNNQLMDRARDLDTDNRTLREEVIKLRGNRVFHMLRIRPPASGEASLHNYIEPEQTRGRCTMARVTPAPISARSERQLLRISRRVAFDCVLSQDAGQQAVLDAVKPFIRSAIEGLSASIVVDGHTGSGKSYTQFGDSANDGLVQHATRSLFEQANGLRDLGWAIEISVAFFEIYLDKLQDLFSNARPAFGKEHEIVGLRYEDVSIPSRAIELIESAVHERIQTATNAHSTSSRSHAILRYRISARGPNAAVHSPPTVSQLNLVDLAGSERSTDTDGLAEERGKETTSINKSMSAFRTAVASRAAGEHVSLRNGMLTRAMSLALSGTGMFAVISTVNPIAEESVNTLLNSHAVLTNNKGKKPQGAISGRLPTHRP